MCFLLDDVTVIIIIAMSPIYYDPRSRRAFTKDDDDYVDDDDAQLSTEKTRTVLSSEALTTVLPSLVMCGG